MVAHRLPEPAEPAENDAQGPVAPTPTPTPLVAQPPEPMVTFSMNGVPMRFRAGALRGLMNDALTHYAQDYADDVTGANGPKMRAFQLAMRGAMATMVPMLRQSIEKARASEKVPAYVKRMLPPMPQVPRHADRFLFMVAYLSECLYAALTENAWELEVTADDPSDPTAMSVTGFLIRDPNDFNLRRALPAPAESDDDPDDDEGGSD